MCTICAHCAPHSYGLRHAATRCNTLQHAATHLYFLFLEADWNLLCWKEKMWCNVLQCTATHCNTLAVSISRGALELSTLGREGVKLLWPAIFLSKQILCAVAATSVWSCSNFCVQFQQLLCDVAAASVWRCSNFCVMLQQFCVKFLWAAIQGWGCFDRNRNRQLTATSHSARGRLRYGGNRAPYKTHLLFLFPEADWRLKSCAVLAMRYSGAWTSTPFAPRYLSCSVLKCAVVSCSVLQCVAVCCTLLQCSAVCCSVLQWVAVCCSVLQCAAVCCGVMRDSFRFSSPFSVYTYTYMYMYT